MPDAYMKFAFPGLMDMNCDRLTESMIAIAHNGIQNGEFTHICLGRILRGSAQEIG